jgi:hypothetical protein
LAADFSEASLSGVGFSNGLELSETKLPMDGEHFWFDAWPERLRAVELASTHLGPEVRRALVEFVQAFQPPDSAQREYIISRADLAAWFGPIAAEDILRLLGKPSPA